MKFYVIAYGNPEDKRQGIFSINFDKKTKDEFLSIVSASFQK